MFISTQLAGKSGNMLKARTVKGKVASEKPNAKPDLNTILLSGAVFC